MNVSQVSTGVEQVDSVLGPILKRLPQVALTDFKEGYRSGEEADKRETIRHSLGVKPEYAHATAYANATMYYTTEDKAAWTPEYIIVRFSGARTFYDITIGTRK